MTRAEQEFYANIKSITRSLNEISDTLALLSKFIIDKMEQIPDDDGDTSQEKECKETPDFSK